MNINVCVKSGVVRPVRKRQQHYIEKLEDVGQRVKFLMSICHNRLLVDLVACQISSLEKNNHSGMYLII